jgi:hypothetical protein
LEYKASPAIDKGDDAKKLEMARDVAAFANADGGQIVMRRRGLMVALMPAPEVFVPAIAAWPAALPRAAPPATLVSKPTLN